MRALVQIAMFASCIIPSVASTAAEAVVKVEFRRAEWEPAPGLTAARASEKDRIVYMRDEVELTNSDIASAKVGRSADGKHSVVDITMTDDGGHKLQKLTREHLLSPLAILIDGKLLIALRIVSELSRAVQISGNFDAAEAERIAAAMPGKPMP